ncbi:hypothetical protein AB0O72_33980, partial [Streptomyces sp. NPDC088106]
MKDAVFRETTAEPRTQSVPLSHLSLELGHLYMEDFEAGPGRLRRHFEAVRPWVEAARSGAAAPPAGGRPPGSPRSHPTEEPRGGGEGW